VQKLKVGSWKPDPGASICAMKLDPDGPIELLGGYAEIDGNTIAKSVMQTPMDSGFDVCVGDARGNGKLQFYQACPKPNEFVSWNGAVYGYDQTGRRLPGWPQPTAGDSGLPPVMGDLLGDGNVEIIAADDHPKKALQDEEKAGHPIHEFPKRELPTSILAEGFAFGGPLSLADLDGSGRAEIVFYCTDHTLRAICGDGHGFGNADGIIAKLPDDARGYGVSIASLNGDNSVDFFVGTFWVHRMADGSTTITRMLPGASNRCGQPTIANIGGEAVVLDTTDDGRVFVYHTGKPYHAERVQWGTIDGDLNHTACWHKPTMAKP
jgi:hypothetical protein